jgi:hypothetical protein
MNLRRKKKTRKTGFKKITIKFPRVKIKRRGSGCGVKEDPDYVTPHTQRRRDGRKIRTMKRMAEQGKAA